MKNKVIAYLKQSPLTFYSDAECICKDKTNTFVLTATNSIIFKLDENEKEVFNFEKNIELSKKEAFKSLALIQKNRLLLVSNRLRLFSLDVDFEQNRLSNFRELGFKLAKNLKSSSNVKFFVFQAKVFLIVGRFLFAFNFKEEQFKILKIFSEEITEVLNDAEKTERLFVLTNNSLYLVSIAQEENELSAKIEAKTIAKDFKRMCFVAGKLVFLSGDSRLHFFDVEKRIWHDKIDVYDSNNTFVEFTGIASLSNHLLIAFNKSFTFVFSEDFSKIKYILNTRGFDYLLCSDLFIDFQRKSENVKRFAEIHFEFYNKENESARFFSKSTEDQIFICFSHLSRKFMKLKEIENPRQTVQELLSLVYLKSSVYKHKKFKEEVLCFLALVKHFLVRKPRMSIEKFMPNKLRIVSLRQLEASIENQAFREKREDIAQVLNENLCVNDGELTK